MATLTFSEDFSGPVLSSIWTHIYGYGGLNDFRLNDEAQIYTGFGVDGNYVWGDGTLSLVAHYSNHPDVTKWGSVISSGMITTRGTQYYGTDEKWHTINNFAQQYGYFEMRAILPLEPGTWPAFWLLPENWSWPPELDIVELVGSLPGQIVTSIHSGAQPSVSVGNYAGVDPGEFHTYGALWTAETITWYVDRVAIWSQPTPADFHQPMMITANLAMGGSWATAQGTKPIDFGADGKAIMTIDYIKVWDGLPWVGTPVPSPPPPPPPPTEPAPLPGLTVLGTKHADRLEGGAGNDTFTGKQGRDVFVFGEGDDRVTDFNSGKGQGDQVDLGGRAYTLTATGEGALITSGGDSLLLLGKSLADLARADWLF
jgi:Ca2+-binding RTX toxin-like protein